MKRIAIICLFLLSASMLFASVDYKLELVSFNPIYREYGAGRNQAVMGLQYLDVYKGFPTYFYQNEIRFDFKAGSGWRLEPFIVSYSVGETMSLGRSTLYFDSFLSPVSMAFEVQGALTSAFEGRFSDLIGYDGVYFFGLSASVGDIVSIRYGSSHYCTHYGDGSFKQIRDDDHIDPDFLECYKYLRMNSSLIGVSVNPLPWIRLYGELDFVLDSTHIRPDIFGPTWSLKGTEAEEVPDDYGNRIVSLGIELEYPIFPRLGNTTLSYQFKTYEEGKIVYRVEDLQSAGRTKAYYDGTRSWESEHSFNLSQEVNDLVSFFCNFHMGRFILNSYYATRSNYVSLGARLNFKGGVTLFDSRAD